MVDELRERLEAVVACINRADEESGVAILLTSLKKYDVAAWQQNIWNLIELKDLLATIPPKNRTLVHSLLEQTLMICIEKCLRGDLQLTVPDWKKIFDARPDSAAVINPQEALSYALSILALTAAKIMVQNNNRQDASFFLSQAQARHVIFSAEDREFFSTHDFNGELQ